MYYEQEDIYFLSLWGEGEKKVSPVFFIFDFRLPVIIPMKAVETLDNIITRGSVCLWCSML